MENSLRHTVIVGAARTGTTATFYAVARGLEGTGESVYALYEQHNRRIYESLDKYAPERLIVSKLLVTSRSFDRAVAAPFSHRVLIVRDPRDTLLSALLFFPVLAINAGIDADQVDAFTDLILRKEQDPESISMKSLLRHGYRLVSPEGTLRNLIASWFLATMRYHDHVPSMVAKYESLVDGELDELEEYLSLQLGNRESDASRSHIARTGEYGSWRNWFVADDLPYFRPLLATYMRCYGYEDDWELPERPTIDPATASSYIQQSTQVRRDQKAILSRSAPPSAERLAVLRSRAETGSVTVSVQLAELLLADGSSEDAFEAFDRLQFASCTGNPRAMRLLSNCYRDGVGVVRDPDRAKIWRNESRSAGETAYRALMS